MEETKKGHLTWSIIVLLVVIAIIADLLSLIPLVGSATGPLYWMFASFVLWKEGYGLLNTRRLATGAISLLAEIIPMIQMLPATILGIIVVIMMIKREDHNKMSTDENSTPKIPARRPVYENGVRLPDRN